MLFIVRCQAKLQYFRLDGEENLLRLLMFWPVKSFTIFFGEKYFLLGIVHDVLKATMWLQ